MTVPLAHPEQRKRAKTTRGNVNYAEKPKDGETLYVAAGVDEHGNRAVESTIVRSPHEVEVQDLRTAGTDFSLQKHGFELHKIKHPEGIDWNNSEQVKKEFYPSVVELVKKATGGSRVHLFDHTLRNGVVKRASPDEGPGVKFQASGPVPLVHVDYDNKSGIGRLSELLPEEADKLRETPFAVIQVWKPLKGPVRSSPLGMIDASTVEREDLTGYELRLEQRIGRNFAVHYNPRHKWYYADGIDTNEAYVFVCYDSRAGRARFTPHSGFEDLSIEADAPPRESVELRSYVFWENEPKQEIERDF